MATAHDWLRKLARLNVYRARGGPAPHKPLLLLVLLQLAEQGRLPDDVLPLTPELSFRFTTYWTVVAHRRTQRPDVRPPFHHLQSDGLWRAVREDGEPSHDDRTTARALLDPGFVAFARDPAHRTQAMRVLISAYFQQDEQIGLCALLGLPPPTDASAAETIGLLGGEEAKQRGRDARFRLTVVAAYNYTCALTGYCLTTIGAGSIVDAAHIHQFARSRNNEPGNGIALSKNAHWLFDAGLWTLSDDFRIVVASERFYEESPDQKSLREYHGFRARLPVDRALWPDLLHVGWHRTNRFLGK